MSSIITPYGGGGAGGYIPMILGYWYPFDLAYDYGQKENEWFDESLYTGNADYQRVSLARRFVKSCEDVKQGQFLELYNSNGNTKALSRLTMDTMYGGYLRISFAKNIHDMIELVRHVNQLGMNLRVDYKDPNKSGFKYIDEFIVGTMYTPNDTDDTASNGNMQHLQYFIDKVTMPYYYNATYDAETLYKFNNYDYGSPFEKRAHSWDSLWRYATSIVDNPSPSGPKTTYIIPFQSGFEFAMRYSTTGGGQWTSAHIKIANNPGENYATPLNYAFAVEVVLNGVLD